jgi:hypothetical protein
MAQHLLIYLGVFAERPPSLGALVNWKGPQIIEGSPRKTTLFFRLNLFEFGAAVRNSIRFVYPSHLNRFQNFFT